MEKFNVGDWVYASDWCYGCIIEIENGFAIVEFDTDSGGGNCSFMLEDLKKAEVPKINSPVGNLYFGIDVKRCDQCEYKNIPEIRDNLLVTAGARAVHMDYRREIAIREGLEEEDKLAEFLTKVIEYYLSHDCGNFDLYLETKLIEKYGGNT